MRIHTSATLADVREAGKVARVEFVTLTEHRSRSRERAFEVILTGESSRTRNWHNQGKAATWDQWGVFLGHLFAVDPKARCWAYDGAHDFHYKTACRFVDRSADVDYATEPVFWPADAHGDHSWEHSPVTGTTCRRCSARQIRR
jgi:hypothetical protein